MGANDFPLCGTPGQEIHTLKTQLEAAKFDVIKYCIGKPSDLHLSIVFHF